MNSAHVNPLLLGLSDGTKAHGLSREPVAVPVRGGGSGVTLTPTKTTLISNACLSLPQPSLVSLRQHCARLPVAMEVCSVATKILHSLPRKHYQSRITSHGLQTLTHLPHLHTVSPPVYVRILVSCPALWPSILNDLFGFVPEINLLFTPSN